MKIQGNWLIEKTETDNEIFIILRKKLQSPQTKSKSVVDAEESDSLAFPRNKPADTYNQTAQEILEDSDDSGRRRK